MRECTRLGREVEEIRKVDQERIQMLEQQVGASFSFSATLNQSLYVNN